MEEQRWMKLKQWSVRLLFLIVALALPLEIVALRTVGEPYPALYLPSFASGPPRDGTFTRTDPFVSVQFNDGTATEIDYRMLLPSSQLHAPTAFRHSYSDADRANSPEVVAWLREVCEREFPGVSATQIVIDWTKREFTVPNFKNGTVVSVRTVVVDL